MIDTHAHLTNAQLHDNIQQFLEQATSAGVKGILTVGTSLEDSLRCVELASRFDPIRAAVGIHPNHCHEAQAGDWAEIVRISVDPRVVALGETGLDRYWHDCPWEVQLDYFRRHIALSRRTGLPVVIHTRDCADEMLEVLRKESKIGGFPGVMHAFSASPQIAQGCIDLGLYISFAGTLTFKNAAEIQSVAKLIPADRLLVETDCPYLTPHPFRGQRPNHPAMVGHTLEKLAELRDIASLDLAAQTTQNAHRLFNRWHTTMPSQLT